MEAQDPFIYDVDPDFDFIVDEKGNTYIALRKVRWGKDENKPHKLEIRKWRTNSDGSERADKGTSFLTEQGPHELTRVLVEQGYGDTNEIAKLLLDRGDLSDNMSEAIQSTNVDTIDYYDPKSCLLDDII